MKRIIKIALIAFVVVIAINITVVITLGFKGESPAPTPTPQSSVVATSTSTSQPGSTAASDATPTSTTHPSTTAAPTATPAATQTLTTIVSISTVSQVKKGALFSVDVNINNVAYMAYAQFDIKFNSGCINYSAYNPVSQIGGGIGDVFGYINEPGLLRIMVDYSAYAEAHDDNGVSGSGYLCKLTFTAVNTGI